MTTTLGLGLLLAGALALASCTEDRSNAIETHCFNERLTLPSFVSTNCPTINPTP